MRKLANLIENQLKEQKICAVYDSELARIWPKRINLTKRKRAIARFAKAQGFAVTFYDVGLCAIFEKSQDADHHEVILPLPLKRSPKRRRSKKN